MHYFTIKRKPWFFGVSVMIGLSVSATLRASSVDPKQWAEHLASDYKTFVELSQKRCAAFKESNAEKSIWGESCGRDLPLEARKWTQADLNKYQALAQEVINHHQEYRSFSNSEKTLVMPEVLEPVRVFYAFYKNHKELVEGAPVDTALVRECDLGEFMNSLQDNPFFTKEVLGSEYQQIREANEMIAPVHEMSRYFPPHFDPKRIAESMKKDTERFVAVGSQIDWDHITQSNRDQLLKAIEIMELKKQAVEELKETEQSEVNSNLDSIMGSNLIQKADAIQDKIASDPDLVEKVSLLFFSMSLNSVFGG